MDVPGDFIPAMDVVSSGTVRGRLALSQVHTECCDPRSFVSQCLGVLHKCFKSSRFERKRSDRATGGWFPNLSKRLLLF